MATINMKQAKKWATHYGVNCQLIPGASETNCKAVIYNGIKHSTSNWTGIMFDSFFAEIACGQNVDGSSVAKQKINEAHGRAYGERLVNFLEQYMTYADPFENIQFVGQTWISVLNQLVEREMDFALTEVNQWKESMKEWHVNSDEVVTRMIESKEVRILNNHVIPSKSFERFLIQYCKENNYTVLSQDKINLMIDMYCKRYQEVIG